MCRKDVTILIRCLRLCYVLFIVIFLSYCVKLSAIIYTYYFWAFIYDTCITLRIYYVKTLFFYIPRKTSRKKLFEVHEIINLTRIFINVNQSLNPINIHLISETSLSPFRTIKIVYASLVS